MRRLLIPVVVFGPLIEIGLLVWLAHAVGVVPTLGLLVASALVGGWLARRVGAGVMRRSATDLRHGRVPEEGLLSSGLVLAGGLLLAVPGLLSDAVGLVLLLGPARRPIARALGRALGKRLHTDARVIRFEASPSEDALIDDEEVARRDGVIDVEARPGGTGAPSGPGAGAEAHPGPPPARRR